MSARCGDHRVVAADTRERTDTSGNKPMID